MTRDVLAALVAALAAKRPVVLVTRLETGDARLLDPFSPMAGEPPDVAAAAREAALRDTSAVLEAREGRLFLRAYLPPVRLVVIGAVHVAQALAPMARLAGYEVIVVDPRRAFATEARFEGVRLERAWPDEALARLGLDRRTAVVTLTHDPKIDDPALVAALRSDAFHVGALGSRKTQAARRERLARAGVPEAALARLRGPVGLALGARTPGEIAVSILAELVGALRAGPAARPGGA